MYAEERQVRILEMVNSKGKVSVAELSRQLEVSPVTIRRDLERLEEMQLLIRTHGGAMAIQNQLLESAREKSFTEKTEAYAAEKERIAEAAAELVENESSVLLSPGTTNMLVAHKLAGKKDLTVVTNAVNIALQLGCPAGWEVLLTGGKLREKSYAMVGPIAEQALQGLNADWLFLGVDGLHLHDGLSTPNMAEASINRKMIEAAKRVVVVADRSKFGRKMFSKIAPLSSVHIVITDDRLPADQAKALRDVGIEVRMA
ncbi:DeoR/GlpR family DNA-binding transcription regulator [Paenibacillus senegalensis]|uniref:DeoR/GlpR family DNA-binding transcription regulator n=1 Tax=Paenibacillus senegalensis TaxID=1465766 RepID=UPI00028A15C7|nr:DeoR/GlpR family DNA-binding transcription regulator [Paenibacillus senegalensis]